MKFYLRYERDGCPIARAPWDPDGPLTGDARLAMRADRVTLHREDGELFGVLKDDYHRGNGRCTSAGGCNNCPDQIHCADLRIFTGCTTADDEPAECKLTTKGSAVAYLVCAGILTAYVACLYMLVTGAGA